MSYNFKTHNDRNVIVTLKQHAMWIKQMEQKIDAIIKGGISIKLPFDFTKDGDVIWKNEGNVIFNQNIVIQNEQGNIENLYEYLKELNNEIVVIRELVESISDINNIESVVKELNNIHSEIDSITDHLVGFVRKSEESKTVVNDELEISKQLTISSNEVINASIVGYSGKLNIGFETDGFDGILCVGHCEIDGKRVSRQHYYTAGSNVDFQPELLYLISLVGGKIVGNECRFDKINTDLSIVNKNTSTNEEFFKIDLDVASGSCVINNTGAEFVFNLGSNTKLSRPAFTFDEEVEGVMRTFNVNATNYTLHGTDNSLKFTTSEITYDDINKEIKTVGDVKLIIEDSDNSFNVFNSESITTEETEISFGSGSYLNGFKETSAIVPIELVNAFKELHNIEGEISYGANIKNKSEGVGIVFKGSDGDVNLLYKSIRTDPDNVSKVKRVLYIDSDVKIKYGDNDNDVITFSELYGILLNRIITLERKANFTYSTDLTGMTPEGGDNVGDAKIIAIYDDATHEGVYEKYPA